MAEGRPDWRVYREGGGSIDTDGRPGSSSDSPQYARIYDRRSESEFSGRLETASQIRAIQVAEQIRTDQERDRYTARDAQSRVHVFPTVGKFIIPEENTWAAHAQLVQDGAQNLYFNPEKYAYFDKIIADRLGMKALTDKNHPDYMKWQGLRDNLAVLRNDVIGIYLNDGSFDPGNEKKPGDERHLPNIIGVAEAIADGLAADTWYKRPFTNHIDMEAANTLGIGARMIYQYLIERQTKPIGILEGVRSRFNDAVGIPNRSWGLPQDIEKTPFGEKNLLALPPLEKQCITPEQMARYKEEDNKHVVNLCTDTVGTACAMQSIDTLEPPTRETSVEEARKILRWLRNLQFTDQNVEEFVSQGTPAEQGAKMEALARLVEIYSGQLHTTTRHDPRVMSDLSVQDGRAAAETISLGISMFSLHVLPDMHPDIDRLERAMEKISPDADMRETQPTRRLLDTLETGLSRMSGREASDLPPAERLAETSRRLTSNALKLRSIETLEPPTREESIELAREILRKLRNIKFSDAQIKELIDQGTPEDRAAFAQKIDEMVDIYKNLMFEAAQVNPGLLTDPKVKEANDAAGALTHTVSLMAAKEMPNSLAAAQQISADATQTPEEWKELHNRTVDRLVKSMEGGLEQAVTDLQMQQNDTEQAEEQGRESSEAALMHADLSRRRRRRRRQQSGAGGAKQRKSTQAIEADDYVLKQGRFRDDGIKSERPNRAPAPAAMAANEAASPVLRPEDLATVRELGNALRGANQDAVNLPIKDVSNSEMVAPDDKSVAARVIEQEQKPRSSSRRSQNSSSSGQQNPNRPNSSNRPRA